MTVMMHGGEERRGWGEKKEGERERERDDPL